MFRSIPVQNKLCFQREHERKIQMHETKIRDMKKMIDNAAPPQYEFLITRKKKEALAQERENEVKRENMVLLTKISSIDKRNTLSRQQLPTQSNPHGSAFSQTQGSSMFPGTFSKVSLNKEQRKKEFVKMVVENQALLRRIQDSKSEYNVKTWEKDRVKNEKYISHISEYQYKDYKPNKTFIKLGVWHEDQKTQTQILKRPNGKLQPIFKGKQQSNLIYKNGRRIGSYSYLVEIKTEKEFLIMTLENLQKKSNIICVQLPLEEGMNILDNECQGDPELFIDRVRIDEKTNSFFFRKIIDPVEQEEHKDITDHQISPNQSQGNTHHLRVTEEKEEEEEHSILPPPQKSEQATNDHLGQSQIKSQVSPTSQKPSQQEIKDTQHVQERGEQTEEIHNQKDENQELKEERNQSKIEGNENVQQSQQQQQQQQQLEKQ